jgi:pSer/pThr/pTyr-binding forkhead associated (FHA) protein
VSVCHNCGKENQAHYKYCLGCGAELSGEPVARPPVVARTVVADPDPPEPAAGTGDGQLLDALADVLDRESETGTNPSWFTSGPATENEMAAASGAPPLAPSLQALAPASRPGSARACPSCGNAVPVDFAFCGQCGARIDTERPAGRTMFLGAEAEPHGSPRGRLVLIRPDGSEGGMHSLAEGENPIGRGFGPLFDGDGYLSPRHAELVLNAAGLVVRDTNSLNGVFVKLINEEEIFDGEVFRIGQELLRFDAIRAPEPLEDGTEVLGSPNPGYWGRLAVIVGRDQDGSAFPLFGDAVVLGRERGDILFPEDGYVSGTHARISTRDDRYFLTDLNSSNGTFLRIHGERVVDSGSFLLMGQQLFRVVYG